MMIIVTMAIKLSDSVGLVNMHKESVLNHRIQGEGEPLIILHGLFGSMDNLIPVARRLSEHFQVISVDLRNHGRSFHAPDMSYPLMADDVLALMDKLSITQAVLLGHSMGGKVAMQLALDHPERVGAVVVADIAPVAYPSQHTNVIRAIESYQPEQALSRKAADEQLARYIEMPEVRQLLIKSLKRNDRGEFVWRMNVTALVANYDGIRSAPNVGDRVYSGRVLFVKGERSDYLQSAHRKVIAGLFPKASLKVMAGTDHWLHAEKPDLFCGIVERFLETLH